MNRRSWLKRRPVQAGLLCTLLASCTVGPDYQAPTVPVPVNWSSELAAGQDQARSANLAAWWENLDDPVLSDMIARAIANNPDQKNALAVVRQARALRGVSRSGLFPDVSANGSASTTLSEDTSGDIVSDELYSAGLDASWELDVFGSVRRQVEAADANLEAREADYFDVLTSLSAEVALAYVDTRTLQEQLRITRANLTAQQETYDLTRWREEAGIVTMLDVEQALTNLASTRALVPGYESDLASALNSLSVLIGEAPGGLDTAILQAASLPVAPSSMPMGIPANLLRQRPDIRSAERDLASQSARVGVAVANLYPGLQLFGSIGSSSTEISDLFNSASFAESIGTSVTAPIFNAGRLRQNVEIEDALYEQALAAYESAVLGALKETEDALASVTAARKRTLALDDAVSAARRAYQLARQEYESGLTDFDQVLDAQRTLLTQEEGFVQSKSSEIKAMISLYKALGGGWNPAALVDVEPS